MILKKKWAMCFVKDLTVTFSFRLPAKINNPVSASQVRFQQFPVIEQFCVEGSNKRSDRGHSVNDLGFLLTVYLERQYRHFRFFAN